MENTVDSIEKNCSDAANRYIYMQQAKFSTKLMRWFEKYGDVLTTKIAREMIFKK